jgi:hypothetical protein
MPFPRTWSEELICEWLGLEGYSTETGVAVGVGKGGGRKEADVVGFKIDANSGSPVLEIYHVEVGELSGNHAANVLTLKEKFSPSRIGEACSRCQKRTAFTGTIKYDKLYVDIWATASKAAKFMADPEVIKEGIKVFTLKDLFTEVLASVKTYRPTHVSKSMEVSLPEGFWMLKMIEGLQQWKMLS